MPNVLFIVTVPAKVKGKKSADAGSSSKSTESTPSSATVTPIASKVRDFIKTRPDCEWISEEPFLNGKVWWTSFMFTNKDASSEATVEALCKLGVGQTVAAAAGMEANGKGMILVLPLSIQRIGSRPKKCGHPQSIPYGATISPSNSTDQGDSKLLQNEPVEVNFTSDEDAEEDVEETDETIQVEIQEEDETGKSLKAEFSATIKSRITVDSVINYVFAASEFSFDYVMLILNAGIIACVGLVTNNTVVIVASMLVSPLMGKQDD